MPEEEKLTTEELQILLRDMYHAKNSDKEAIIKSIIASELKIKNYTFYIKKNGDADPDINAVRNEGTSSEHRIGVFSSVPDTGGTLNDDIKALLKSTAGGKRRTYRNKKNKRKFKKSRKRSYR